MWIAPPFLLISPLSSLYNETISGHCGQNFNTSLPHWNFLTCLPALFFYLAHLFNYFNILHLPFPNTSFMRADLFWSVLLIPVSLVLNRDASTIVDTQQIYFFLMNELPMAWWWLITGVEIWVELIEGLKKKTWKHSYLSTSTEYN